MRTIFCFYCIIAFAVSKPGGLFYLGNNNRSSLLPGGTCPHLKSTKTTFVNCTDSFGAPADCAKAISITFARFRCAPHYKLAPANYVIYCFDGDWNKMIPTCVPDFHCPPLKSTETTFVRCTDSYGAPVDCAKASFNTSARFSCAPFYKMPPANYILYCSDGTWDTMIPTCEPDTCPPLKSTETTFVQCTDSYGAKVDCSKAYTYTFARFSCAPYYELASDNYVLYCFDGTWDKNIPACKPVCGKKNVKMKELAIGGTITKRGTYPWVVALYKKNADKYFHICGGTLISRRVIVTAAHCVTNNTGAPYDENLFRVATGKYYRSYDNSNDTDAQFSEVLKIDVAKEYKGSIFQYAADIAVIVTKERFNYTEFIQRVCVDWDSRSAYEDALLGTNGTVNGWGHTVRGANPSPVLKEISLPFIPYDQCYNDIPDDYKPYVRSDKMCAGYRDKGVGVCEGDSGGGLVFPHHSGGRYYLRGVVSVAPQVHGNCNENEYSIYTKISSYITLITAAERAYRS